MSIQISSEGRRHYLIGDTYAIKSAIRDAGGHWDADRRAWWLSKPDKARALAELGASAPAAYVPAAGEQMLVVAGNTYPVRYQLRALGGEWDADLKVWKVPASKANEAAALVSSAPKSVGRRPFRGRRSSGGRRTGCSCGSVEGRSKPTDCWSCRFDGDGDDQD